MRIPTSGPRPQQRVPALLGPLLALALLLPAASAQAAPTPGVAIVGASAGVDAVTADLAQARAAGAKQARIEVSWADLEPEASGARDPAALATLDAVVKAASSRRIKLILMLQSSPCWTSTAPAEAVAACGSDAQRYPPSDYAAYGRIGAFLAARYHGALAALEVWNEPDQANERYWAGPDKAARYAALLRTAYPIIKRADRRLPVLAGAFVGTNGLFLQALYDAGIKGSYDGISVHFYTAMLYGLRHTRQIERKNGDTKPLWLLETGWNSCAPKVKGVEGQKCVTGTTQAQDIRELFAQTRRTRYLKAIAIYKLRDDRDDRFGLLSGTGARKPAFAALRSASTRPTARVRRPSVVLHRTAAGLRVSGGGPDGDLYTLVVRKGGRLRYKATFLMDARNRYAIVLPAVLGTRGLQVRVISQWRGGRGTVRSS